MTGETILVVEDNEGLAELYALWLSESFTVKIANDGREALNCLDASIDVVLLDRRLPDSSGELILEEIREQELDCMIAMVSAVQPSVEIAGFPIDDYITKPVEEEQLREAVDELLLRTEVDVTKQELLALVSRRIVLKREESSEVLSTNEEYNRLERQINRLEDKLEVDPQEISSTYRPESCPKCGFRWDIAIDQVVGFVPLAASVWKCRDCGEITRHRNSEDRRVARR